MIDIHTEEIVQLSRCSPLVPTRPHVSTLMRWAFRGLQGHKLETIKIGGKVCTSREALQRFFERCNSPSEPASVRTSRRRRDDLAQADRELSKEGI